jgi:hypothetical protein
MRPEHRKGEMPDSIYLLVEQFVDDLFAEYEKMEGFEILQAHRMHRFTDRTFRHLMREKLHEEMRKRMKDGS